MEQLWAPWRSSYLHNTEGKKSSSEGCIFCDLPAQGVSSHPSNFILYCSPQAFVILNRYPYNAGHLMVIPRQHVADLMQLSADDYQSLGQLLRQSIHIVKQQLQAEGINVGMNLGKVAGAGVADHCHFHIVPRWNGDTNFMPVVGEIKVISESLPECYDRLLPAFHRLNK